MIRIPRVPRQRRRLSRALDRRPSLLAVQEERQQGNDSDSEERADRDSGDHAGRQRRRRLRDRGWGRRGREQRRRRRGYDGRRGDAARACPRAGRVGRRAGHGLHERAAGVGRRDRREPREGVAGHRGQRDLSTEDDVREAEGVFGGGAGGGGGVCQYGCGSAGEWGGTYQNWHQLAEPQSSPMAASAYGKHGRVPEGITEEVLLGS